MSSPSPKPGSFDFRAAKRRLAELGINRAALAARVDRDRSQVSRWLSGQAQPSVTRKALAIALQTTQASLWVPTAAERRVARLEAKLAEASS